MKSTVDTVYDYVDRARGVDVYIKMLRAVALASQMKAEADGGAVDKLAKGDAGKITEAFDMFDRYKPRKNYKVPPYSH